MPKLCRTRNSASMRRRCPLAGQLRGWALAPQNMMKRQVAVAGAGWLARAGGDASGPLPWCIVVVVA